MGNKNSEERRTIAKNSKAFHDYFIDAKIECGIALAGTEVKSIREGKVNMKDSYAGIKNGELFLYQMHISPYEKGNIFNKDPLRTRKLLVHKHEILKLIGMVKQKGIALVPLELYWDKNHVKVEIGIARGKKLYDKRQDIAKKEAERRIAQHLK
ncbi:MAG: SsrA-binding protein SmpB [Clostridia bacterium]|nr:SsrA-binding protein SmpB [Clostridia bacterium]